MVKLLDWMRLYENWWLRLLNHRFIKGKKPIIFYLRNGLFMEVLSNTEDDGIIEDVFLKEVYCQEGIAINPEDIVFDIGAQKGAFSLYAFSKGAKVYSFEPVSENHLACIHNLRMNNMDLCVLPVAVAGPPQRDIKIFKKGTGSHSMYGSGDDFELALTTQLDCEIERLASNKRINLLKLDCEGAEYEILYTSQKLNLIDQIVMEWHEVSGQSVFDLKRYLETKGFNTVVTEEYLYARR